MKHRRRIGMRSSTGLACETSASRGSVYHGARPKEKGPEGPLMVGRTPMTPTYDTRRRLS